MLHIARLVEESYKLGVTTFDFLRGEERYKYEWTNDESSLFRLEISDQDLSVRVKSAARANLHSAARLFKR